MDVCSASDIPVFRQYATVFYVCAIPQVIDRQLTIVVTKVQFQITRDLWAKWH
jgi:hypothetical protein